MKSHPSAGDPPGQAPASRSGIAGRVEAAAKARAPSPPGKGLVVMLLAVVVMGALIWDFMGNSSASRAVSRGIVEGEKPIAQDAPGGAADGPSSAGSDASGAFTFVLQDPVAGAVQLGVDEAFWRLAGAEEAERAGLREQFLAQLVKPSGQRGVPGRVALETAARFAEGAEPASATLVAQITLRAFSGLRDDTVAPGALLFLSRLPDHGGPHAFTALDEIIVDPERPLMLRVQAAQLRPVEGRPEPVERLAQDPATHPALRDALQ